MLIEIFIALLAGLFSFFSPCVLPIVPGYISFITGIGLEKLVDADEKKNSRRIIFSSLFFIAGFSLIFILLGASASIIGSFLQSHMSLISIIAGIGIIIFGLHMIGIFKITYLYREKKVHQEYKNPGFIRSFLAGLFFAFGWTPCIGPVLSAILTLAAVSENFTRGILLLSFYAVGLAIPFFLAAIFLKFFITYIRRISKHLRKIEIILGIILILIGILIASDRLFELSSRLSMINLDKIIPEKWAEQISSN